VADSPSTGSRRGLAALASLPSAVAQILALGLLLIVLGGRGDLAPGRAPWFLVPSALLLAASLGTAILKRRPYTAPRFGFLLAHLAPLLLVGGLLVEGWSGERHEAPLASALAPEGQNLGRGLRLRVEEIQLPPQPLTVTARPAEGPNRLLGQHPPKEGTSWKTRSLGAEVRFGRLLPRAVDRGGWVEDPDAPEDPALRVLLGIGEPEPRVGLLRLRDPEASARLAPDGRFEVRFVERFDAAQPRDTPRLRLEMAEGALEHPADPARPWELPGFTLRVGARHSSFPPHLARTAPALRELQGPWVEAQLVTADGQRALLLLSARHPELCDRLNASALPPGARLRLLEPVVPRQVVFDRSGNRILLLEEGRLRREAPLVLGQPFVVAPGRSVTPVAHLAHTRWAPDFTPLPEGLEHPEARTALQVTVRDAASGRVAHGWLEAPGPGEGARAETFFGRLSLALHPAEPAPKDLKATMILVDAAGRILARKTLHPGRPVALGPYTVRAATVPGETGPVLGLRAERRPGLPLLGAGSGLLLLGLAWMFFLKPWLKLRHPGGTP